MSKNPEAKVTVKMLNEEFKKGAQELGEESKTLSKKFKLQSEQMKLTASETEKLEARLDFLKQKQDNASRSVENAQKSYDKAVEVFGENSKAAEDLEKKLMDAKIEEQKFANEVYQANKKLQDQQTEADESGKKLDDLKQKAEDAGKKMKDMGEGAKDIGGKMTAGLTVPIAAVGGAAFKSAADFETAQARMQAQLGLTEEQTVEYGEVARDVWKNAFGENIGEVTESIGLVKQNIQELNDTDLQKVVEQAYTLKDVFGIDVEESSRTASVMMKNFGIDATSAMDLMTVGMQKGGNFSDELLDTMREYSPAFSNMGHSAEDMMNILICEFKNEPPNEIELVRFIRNKVIKACKKHIDLKQQRFRTPSGKYILFTKERIKIFFYEDLEIKFR